MSYPWYGYGQPEDRGRCAKVGAAPASACLSAGGSKRSTAVVHHSFDRPEAPAAAGPQARAVKSFGGRYRVLRPLGESGCERSYLARDLSIDRDVAVEAVTVPELGCVELPELVAQVRAIARLDAHPGVAGVLDLGEQGGRPYVVTQYLPGGSLADLLKRCPAGRLPIPHALRIAEQVCAALAYLHSHAMVHRNLKPANVLFAEGGSVTLSGFGFGLGLAIELSRNAGVSAPVGDLSYAAPEQLIGQTDFRTDLYSLGAILYQMIGGRPPFKGSDSSAIAIQHLHRMPAPLSRRVGNLPPALEALIVGLLRKPPAQRPSSAEAVREQIRAVSIALAAQPVSDIGPADVRAGRAAISWLRKPRLAGAGAAAAAAILSLALTWVYHRSIPNRPVEALACHPFTLGEPIKLWRQENADAQMAPAGIYLWGDGVRNEYGEAIRRLEQTAAAGDAIAQVELGDRYAKGEGVRQDYNEALRWFREAAQTGNADGEYNLAMMYQNAPGVPRDPAEALRWLRKAAAGGSADAQYGLGSAYLTGEGVGQDDQRALYWFRAAAAQGNVGAQNAMGLMYEQGRGVAQSFGEALQWYGRAAASGDAKAQLNLGLMNENGEGVARDYSKASEWYRRAAQQGDAYAETCLGVLYCKGSGVAKDFAKALEWLRKAAAQDEPRAQFNLGVMYDNGLGVERNYAEAARWYRAAAAHGHVDAQFNLAYMYEHGQGVPRSYADAVDWYRKAAAQGDSDAARKLRAMALN
ncbi:MAG: protein kinase [Candidatus Binataceae bacterium]